MFLVSKVQLVRRSDNLLLADCLYSVESLTSHKPTGLWPVTGIALLFFIQLLHYICKC
jgi:hypothetical protein